MAEEEKKENDVGKFFWTFVLGIVCFIVYFNWGSTILYGCKLAEAGVLPTNVNKAPFVDIREDTQPSKVGLFADKKGEVKTEDGLYLYELLFNTISAHKKRKFVDGVYSEVAGDDTTDWMLFDALKVSNPNDKRNPLGKIFVDTFAKNMSMYETFFNGISKICGQNDTAIIYLGPIAAALFIPFGIIASGFMLAYDCLINVKDWATKMKDGTTPIKWEKGSRMSFLFWNYIWLLISAALILGAIIPVTFTIYSALGIIVMIICWAVVSLYPNNVPNLNDKDKKASNGTLIQGLKRYETINLFLINVIFVACAWTSFNNTVAGGVTAAFVIVCLAAYMKWIRPFNSADDGNVGDVEMTEGTTDKGTIDKGTIDKGTIDKGTIDKGIEGLEGTPSAAA
jgi:hypothetical protein